MKNEPSWDETIEGEAAEGGNSSVTLGSSFDVPLQTDADGNPDPAATGDDSGESGC